MSKPKRIEDFTFREYFSDLGRKEQKEFVISILAPEGLSEEQLNEMNMKRVWSLFLDAMGEVLERDWTKLNELLVRNPEAARLARKNLQNIATWLKSQTEELERKLQEEKKGSQ